MKRLLFILLLLVLSGRSHACSCAPLTLKEYIAGSEFIFKARVLRVDTIEIVLDFFIKENLFNPDSLGNYVTVQYLATVEVEKLYKGTIEEKHITVITGQGGGDCGYDFTPGISYLIYSAFEDYNLVDMRRPSPYFKKAGLHTTNTCTRITREVRKEARLLKRFFKNKKVDEYPPFRFR